MIKFSMFLGLCLISLALSISYFDTSSKADNFEYKCEEIHNASSSEGPVTSITCYEISGLPGSKLSMIKGNCSDDKATGYTRTWSEGSCPTENRVGSCIDPFFLKMSSGASSFVYLYYEGVNVEALKAHCRAIKGKFEEG